MTDKNRVVILAAGKGTRLKTLEPKPLVKIRGKALIDYVLESVDGMGEIAIIIGYKAEEVKTYINEKYTQNNFEFIVQEEQLGTGHALMTYLEKSKTADAYEKTFVLCADTPLIEKTIFETLEKELLSFEAIAATFKVLEPKGYGRIVNHKKGFSIVEEKDANEDEKRILEVNAAIYLFKTKYLKDRMGKLDTNNKAGEFYLTDAFKENLNVKALLFDEGKRFMGVNDLYQLSQAENYLKKKIHKTLMIEKGVYLIDPSHTYVYTSNIGKGTIIHPNTSIDETCVIGRNVLIEMGVVIKNSIIEDNAVIKANSYITDSKVGSFSKVGPMAQLRPGCELLENVKIGNFVELKKAKIDSNTSISHLSYLGDAIVGKNVNIGCGFVTCNYDGANKHITEIEDGAFIGSDCQVIAPIKIGKNSYIGSGSTINKSIPEGAFGIARARQETKVDMARKFLKKPSK